MFLLCEPQNQRDFSCVCLFFDCAPQVQPDLQKFSSTVILPHTAAAVHIHLYNDRYASYSRGTTARPSRSKKRRNRVQAYFVTSIDYRLLKLPLGGVPGSMILG